MDLRLSSFWVSVSSTVFVGAWWVGSRALGLDEVTAAAVAVAIGIALSWTGSRWVRVPDAAAPPRLDERRLSEAPLDAASQALRRLSTGPLNAANIRHPGLVRAIEDHRREMEAQESQTRTLVSALGEVSARIEEARSSTRGASGALGTMGQTVDLQRGGLRRAREDAEQARDGTTNARERLDAATRNLQSVEASIRQLTNFATDVAAVTKVVQDISFRTKLLAINASVEAARAGKQGAGFAAVAKEIQALADRSANAAKDTARLLDLADSSASSGMSVATEALHSIQTASRDASTQVELLEQICTALQRHEQKLEEFAGETERGRRGVGSSSELLSVIASALQELSAVSGPVPARAGFIGAPVEAPQLSGDLPSSEIWAQQPFGPAAKGLVFDQDERGYDGF